MDDQLKEQFTEITSVILSNQTEALANLTKKVEREIGQVWRQMGKDTFSDKGCSISEKFSLWLKFSQKRCQNTIYLKRRWSGIIQDSDLGQSEKLSEINSSNFCSLFTDIDIGLVLHLISFFVWQENEILLLKNIFSSPQHELSDNKQDLYWYR